VRIPAPGEAHRYEIRAVTPPWDRGGCDHYQQSGERVLTAGCTCAPSDGWRKMNKMIKTPVCLRKKEVRWRERESKRVWGEDGWVDCKLLVLMARGVNFIAASSSSTLSLSLRGYGATTESRCRVTWLSLPARSCQAVVLFQSGPGDNKEMVFWKPVAFPQWCELIRVEVKVAPTRADRK